MNIKITQNQTSFMIDVIENKHLYYLLSTYNCSK